ncbi:MAG: hypothetical protein Q7S65_02970 [Nanoarchaeota archaeon]|nr:hypothetical protein [Nanoarchaeota archaeon]
MRRSVIFIIGALAVLIVACSPLNDDSKFRIDSLYEHTLIMEELSTPELLREIGLDATQLDKRQGMSYDDKLAQLEAAMGERSEGNYNARIERLEKRMNQMMQFWAQKGDFT